MTTRTRTRLHPAEWLGYTLAVHPRLRHTLTYLSVTHLLALWALIAAPNATAATMATALDWTGIADSENVPVGAYFISVVSTLEAITHGGPEVSAWDPGTWVQWAVTALSTAISHDTVASWVQAMGSVYVMMLVAALWLLRFTLSSVWLYWLSRWAQPLFEVMRAFLINHMFYPACLAIGTAVGAWHILVRHRNGFGIGIIISTFALAAIGMVFLHDPVGDLYSDHGLIAQSRGTAFGIAQAALHNGPISVGGNTGQMNHLTALLADAIIRQPIQQWNFGTVVDGIGSCKQAWSHAIIEGARTGHADVPAHAMKTCGAPQALSYAQSLDASVIGLGLGYWILAAMLGAFLTYASISYGVVLIAALINAFLLLFAAGTVMIHGRPRAGARHRVEETLRHVLYVFAYVLYICIYAVLLMNTVAPGGFAQQIGMTAPLAKLALISLLSVAATVGFWWMKKQLGDRTWQNFVHSAADQARRGRDTYHRGRNAYDKGKKALDKLRDKLNPTDADDDGNSPITNPPVQGRPAAGKPQRPRNQHAQPTSTPPEATTTAPPTANGGGAPAAPSTGNNRPGPSPATQPASSAAPEASRAATGKAAAKTGATRAGATRAGGAASEAGVAEATEAGAAVFAPEVVIPAALAVEAVRGKKRGTSKGSTGKDSGPPQLPPPPRHPRADTRGQDTPGPGPTGPGSGPLPSDPATPPASHPNPGPGPGPAAGRPPK